MRSCLMLAVVCSALLGCAAIDPYAQAPVAQRLQRGDELGECAQRFQASDRLIDTAGTRDAQALRVPGFPHLRVDRVLAALAPSPETTAQQARAWSEELAALDVVARRIELANAGSCRPGEPSSYALCRKRADRRPVDAQSLSGAGPARVPAVDAEERSKNNLRKFTI